MDEKWFRVINRLAGRYSPMDLLMIWMSNKARYVYLFVFVWMWFKSRFSRKTAADAGICAGIAVLVNTFIKLFYYKPRPFVKRRVGILIPSKLDSSFPSKHTLLVFAVSTFIFLRERTIGSVMWTLAVITGFSRIWVGHHYPSDIIGSAFIGSLISMMVDKYSRCFDFLAHHVINYVGTGYSILRKCINKDRDQETN